MSFEALTNRGEYLSPFFVEEVLPGEIRKTVSARWAEREKAAGSPNAEQMTATLVVPPLDAGFAGTAEPATTATATTATTAMLVEPADASLAIPGLADPPTDPDPAVKRIRFVTAVTPRAGLRELRRYYYEHKSDLLALDPGDDVDKRAEVLRHLHDGVLAALSFAPHRHTRTVVHNGVEVVVSLAAEAPGVWAIECGWATEADAAVDPAGAGRLLDPVALGPRETVTHGMRLASHLFAVEEPPRYVLLLAGGVVILADRRTWGEGRYLAASLDVAFGRNDAKPGGELDVIAALFGADALSPPEAGGTESLAALGAGSQKQAVGVTAELRDGLRESVELIANEVLARLSEAGVRPEQLDDLKALGDRLTREALRYLYRILVLLYAEARPELGVLPIDHPEYAEGYSLARLGDLAARRPPTSPADRAGTHLFDSLNLLFKVVNEGYRARGTVDQTNQDPAAEPETSQSARRRVGKAAPKVSEREGIRFEPLGSDLFEPAAITLIGQALDWPGAEDEDDDEPVPAGRPGKIDTRLRNAVLYRVLRRLMITKGGRRTRGGARRQGGFISYAQLGINQLGAVYEGLISYTGFIAGEDLYEVAKGGDPKDGSWTVPASRADDYPPEVFVHEIDEDGHRTDRRRRYPAGSFVYRLSGRDRQTSASYYTPQSLTEVTVQLALKYRIEEAGPDFTARHMLDWTICEPALGSGAFLNEAINQVAAEYLRRRQEEKQQDGTLDEPLDPERYLVELQRVKAYIALHNSYGVDLNATAIELADVSLWLNVMHAGLQAPWFGLHLRRGNSLVGAGRRCYTQDVLADRSWLTTAPVDHPFRDGALPKGAIHHFLLPAAGWGAVATEKEAKELAPADAKKLATWRRAITKAPTTKAATGKANQAAKLAALSRRAEYLWTLVQQRLALSEAEIRRQIDVWGADDLPEVRELVNRQKIKDDLEAPGTPYWRLKKLMDAWCALWFWPVDGASLLDGTAPDYRGAPMTVTTIAPAAAQPAPSPEPVTNPEAASPPPWETASIFSDDGTIADAALAAPKADAVTARKERPGGRRPSRPIERLRGPIPLANLDDWIRFATALIGAEDVEQGTFVTHFSSLDELETHEEDLASWLGQEDWLRLAELFPWLDTVEAIATRQGFFHWEVEFAQVFQRGGFDLQVGNPPWVRPEWKENLVLAERDPWFSLVGAPATKEYTYRRKSRLTGDFLRDFLADFATNSGMATLLAATSFNPLLAGTQPDLHRAFMCRVWSYSSPTGIASLIHPDSHFRGAREANLRRTSHHHLRLHAGFVNAANWAFAPPVGRNIEFGIHVYGSARTVSFLHLSKLYAASTLIESVYADGRETFIVPGQKYRGAWDIRPHSSRIITVNSHLLAEWQDFRGEDISTPDSGNLLQPISMMEQGAIRSLSRYRHRLRGIKFFSSSGYHEAQAKKDGIIEPQPGATRKISSVVLQGSHIGISHPFYKQPEPSKIREGKIDWVPCEPISMGESFTPTTYYVRRNPKNRVDLWAGQNSTQYYRLAYRSMIDPKAMERSLYVALIPPGPAHVHAVHSISFTSNLRTALAVGLWSSLPVDYFLRITGRTGLQISEIPVMPDAHPDHPLAPALLLRTLRLNCLTGAYAEIWKELSSSWNGSESWAVSWPKLPSLAKTGSPWDRETPLRTERERRSALVEIDALAAVWLGIGADALIAIYRSRYPILADREDETYFDSTGRRISRDPYAYGYRQEKGAWEELNTHLEDNARRPPAGYAAPFYRADRETEMRAAHAVFSARLQAARDAGWREDDGGSAGQEAGRGVGEGSVVGPGAVGG